MSKPIQRLTLARAKTMRSHQKTWQLTRGRPKSLHSLMRMIWIVHWMLHAILTPSKVIQTLWSHSRRPWSLMEATRMAEKRLMQEISSPRWVKRLLDKKWMNEGIIWPPSLRKSIRLPRTIDLTMRTWSLKSTSIWPKKRRKRPRFWIAWPKVEVNHQDKSLKTATT